jgi:hypothetical protein
MKRLTHAATDIAVFVSVRALLYTQLHMKRLSNRQLHAVLVSVLVSLCTQLHMKRLSNRQLHAVLVSVLVSLYTQLHMKRLNSTQLHAVLVSVLVSLCNTLCCPKPCLHALCGFLTLVLHSALKHAAVLLLWQ